MYSEDERVRRARIVWMELTANPCASYRFFQDRYGFSVWSVNQALRWLEHAGYVAPRSRRKYGTIGRTVLVPFGRVVG
jgi:hypothetical protein